GPTISERAVAFSEPFGAGRPRRSFAEFSRVGDLVGTGGRLAARLAHGRRYPRGLRCPCHLPSGSGGWECGMGAVVRAFRPPSLDRIAAGRVPAMDALRQ